MTRDGLHSRRMAEPKKLHLIDVPGWGALTPDSRKLLMSTCVGGCGRPREGRSERCAECQRNHRRVVTTAKVARWRARGQA